MTWPLGYIEQDFYHAPTGAAEFQKSHLESRG